MVNARSARIRGASMIEILVTLVIIAFGLLGMVGLQARLQVSEVESYQRSQALVLASDIANRIAVNRNNAAAYVTGTSNPLGTAATCAATSGSSTMAQIDLSEWCNALQGAAELTAGNTRIGVLIGGRGCVTQVGADFMVTVTWQGLAPLGAPPASVGCGANAFNTAGTSCVSDLCRRYVTTLVRVATL
jgi:type IV pilus assembly protein PilV